MSKVLKKFLKIYWIIKGIGNVQKERSVKWSLLMIKEVVGLSQRIETMEMKELIFALQDMKLDS